VLTYLHISDIIISSRDKESGKRTLCIVDVITN
jgi:hypothetical protein